MHGNEVGLWIVVMLQERTAKQVQMFQKLPPSGYASCCVKLKLRQVYGLDRLQFPGQILITEHLECCTKVGYAALLRFKETKHRTSASWSIESTILTWKVGSIQPKIHQLNK